MRLIKPIILLIIIIYQLKLNIIFSEETPLKFYPSLSTKYFSSGSILHYKSSGSAYLSSISLNAEKSISNWAINGTFIFTTVKNANINSSYFNPELNFENQRSYYNIKINGSNHQNYL